jgi:hypothetical protein
VPDRILPIRRAAIPSEGQLRRWHTDQGPADRGSITFSPMQGSTMGAESHQIVEKEYPIKFVAESAFSFSWHLSAVNSLCL